MDAHSTTSASLIVGQRYTRENVADAIGLPDSLRKGGSWATGYMSWNGATYIFTNVGTAGRTGHNYPNRWDGRTLVWYGKTDSHLLQPQIDKMVSGESPVHVFWRVSDRAAFTYAGRGVAVETWDESPVCVAWAFDIPPSVASTVPRAVQKQRGNRRGPPPSTGQRNPVHLDGPTHVYIMRLHGPVGSIVPTLQPGKAVIKVGLSNYPLRRLEELNWGFPPNSSLSWKIEQLLELPTGREAFDLESRCLGFLVEGGFSTGGEFGLVPEEIVGTIIPAARSPSSR